MTIKYTGAECNSNPIPNTRRDREKETDTEIATSSNYTTLSLNGVQAVLQHVSNRFTDSPLIPRDNSSLIKQIPRISLSLVSAGFVSQITSQQTVEIDKIISTPSSRPKWMD